MHMRCCSVVGMASGMETVCGQAFGARQFELVGWTLQRAVPICLLTAALPCLALWGRAGPLMLALGQEPGTVELARHYLWRASPALLLSAPDACMRYYFAAHGTFVPQTLASAAAVLLLPFYNHFFVFFLRLGLTGAAWAHACLQATSLLFLLLIMRSHNAAQPPGAKTWTGFSARIAFSGWMPYLKIALPSLVFILLDWCAQQLTALRHLLACVRDWS